MKSFPMAEIIARIMYIVRRKGMRLAAMVKSDVEKLMMCPKLDLHAVMRVTYTAHSEFRTTSFATN
jgi:hypothetical protein